MDQAASAFNPGRTPPAASVAQPALVIHGFGLSLAERIEPFV